LDLVKYEWEELSLRKEECVTVFNELFCRLSSKLEPHQPMPAEMSADAYAYKIAQGNQGVYKDLVRYIGMRDRPATLEQRMEHLSSLDTSLNQSQPESSFIMNTNTTTKASARKMDSKKGSTTGTLTGQVKDDGLTCYICGQVGYISRKCPNCNLMKKLLEQALVGRDAPKAKSGRPPKTRNGDVHQPVERRVGGLQTKWMLSRR
jgi:hypothetical protein